MTIFLVCGLQLVMEMSTVVLHKIERPSAVTYFSFCMKVDFGDWDSNHAVQRRVSRETVSDFDRGRLLYC